MSTILYGRTDTLEHAMQQTKLPQNLIHVMPTEWCAQRQPITEDTLLSHAMLNPNKSAAYIATTEETVRDNNNPRAKRTKRTVFIYCALNVAVSSQGGAAGQAGPCNVEEEAAKPYRHLTALCEPGGQYGAPMQKTGGGAAHHKHVL